MTKIETSTHAARRRFVILATLVGILLVALLLIRFGGASVWDDAYFSVRYADNLLATGEYSWNVGETPVFGLTSVYHGWLIVALRLVFGGSPALLLLLCSLGLGLLAFYLLYRLVLHYSDPLGHFRWHALLFLALTIGFNATQLAEHFSSGMDTTLAMAYLCLYLLVVKRYEPQLSPGKSLLIGILGGMAYFVRPDLLVFTVGVPMALAIFSKRRLMRLQAAYLLIFTSFALITQAFLTTQYYGTFLPLSFYAKSLHTTGADLQVAYQLVSWKQFGLFLGLNWLPVLVLLGALALNFRRWRGAFTIVDKVLVLCLAGFTLYHLFLVVPVMGYSARFYYPAWPVLMYLATRSTVVILTIRPDGLELIHRWSRGLKGGIILGITLLVLGGLALPQRPSNVRTTFGQFDIKAVYQILGQHNWPFLDRFSVLPDALTLASTELGILSAMNPEKQIVDLAGLHDPILAQKGFDADRLVWVQRPDLIYLPHPDYREMNEILRKSNSFLAEYELYEAEALGSFMGVALRKDSPYFHQMRFIAVPDSKE